MKMSGAKPSGKLRIGDDWNAITIIALSQSNPLKAVAEFVENSIDAQARNIVLTRGREKGEHFLRIKDDGQGVPRNADGAPDFDYVATHICDSIKRRLKAEGAAGLQGEFGIGLLSFWTLGQRLWMTCTGDDGRAYQMRMQKGDPAYEVVIKNLLLPEPGTELLIKNILPALRQLSGEKIQWYLASELRDRIRQSQVNIRVIDRTARAEYKVEPRQFEGRLLHHLRPSPDLAGELYVELYLAEQSPANRVGLYRRGTRVMENLSELEVFSRPPWTSGWLQGVVDASYLVLTPGTRLGVIHDANLERLVSELEPVAKELADVIEAQRQAEEERTSRQVLRTIQSALKEALLALPAEEYDWFNLRAAHDKNRLSQGQAKTDDALAPNAMQLSETPPAASADSDESGPAQLQFFEHPGPLFSVRIHPASSVVSVLGARNFRAVPRDRSRRLVEQNVSFSWRILEGDGQLENAGGEIVTFAASTEPGLVRLGVTAIQESIECQAEALVTVTDSLISPREVQSPMTRGIPGYTYQKAPGQLWRSRFDSDQNVVVINNGHRDFVYASGNKSLKLRYICRLYAKELVLKNFAGVPADQLLERMIELTLYAEENLK